MLQRIHGEVADIFSYTLPYGPTPPRDVLKVSPLVEGLQSSCYLADSGPHHQIR